MGIETHKVEVVPVKLEPHPNADRLSIVRVYNFQVVVGTENWLGVDRAAYVQPDSVMPDYPQYRYLKETASLVKEREAAIQAWQAGEIGIEERDARIAAVEARVDANTKYLRIAVKKLRGVVSMGMLVPAPEGSQVGDAGIEMHCGSRTEWKKESGGSNWWRAVEQNPWIGEWCRENAGRVLYGEVFGWVQALKYGAKPGQLFFRAFDFQKLQALADGQSLIPRAGCMREGIVVKPLKERQHWKLGRVMAKFVSNAYLEKSSR